MVKLGGSVITDKSKVRTARPAVIRRLAKEVATAEDDMILVHGAGSFGHIVSREHRLAEGYRTGSQLKGVAEVQRDVRKLNLMVVDALVKAGANPVSVPPSLAVRLNGGKVESLDARPFREYLRIGTMPVTFGDVVVDKERRFGICSGDDLMLALSREFKPRMSLFVSDVDGIFTGDPKEKEVQKLIREIGAKDMGEVDLSVNVGIDVTGGIKGKLTRMVEMAGYSGETWILNGLVPGRLEDALAGRQFAGTRVVK